LNALLEIGFGKSGELNKWRRRKREYLWPQGKESTEISADFCDAAVWSRQCQLIHCQGCSQEKGFLALVWSMWEAGYIFLSARPALFHISKRQVIVILR
jgi:hypothetical protein